MGLNFTGMIVGGGMCLAVVGGTSFICSRSALRSFVRSTGFPGRYRAALKVSRPGGGCDRRLALIRGCA